MVNYQDGKIYKIVDNTNDNVYIGSTCKLLCQRLAQHVYEFNLHLKGIKKNLSSFKVLENGNYDIILIEKFPCEDKEELHKKERFYIENTENCINKMIPSRSQKEYYEDNKVVVAKKRQQYYEANKSTLKVKKAVYRTVNAEKLKQQRRKVCICQTCNCEYIHDNKARHERSKKHQDNLLATKQ